MKLNVTRKPDASRLRKALLHQGEPDRVPFIELGVHRQIKEKIMERPVATVADEIAFARLAGYDYVKLQPIVNMNPGNIHPKGGQLQANSPDGGQRKWATEHEGVITNEEDFQRYVWAKPQDIVYSRLDEATRLLPDDMMIIGQYGDIYTFVWESMGFETFAMQLYEDPDLVGAMFDTVGSIVYSMFETMATYERVGALWYSDDLAYTGGLMIAPEFFREYLFPWVKKMGDLCKNMNIPFLYHSDGVLWEVLEDLIACGVTALHPIEPKSMDVADVKQRAGGRLTVLGSIEVDTLCRGSREEIEALVIDRLRRAAPGGGFCLGSSNSVPDYADVNNYITMLETGDRLGTYPICV